jgi:hypothetical protein
MSSQSTKVTETTYKSGAWTIVDDQDLDALIINANATSAPTPAPGIGSAAADIQILAVRRFGLICYQVYVRGVLATEALSEQGARHQARLYIMRLAGK